MADTVKVDVISKSTAPPIGWIPIIGEWSPANNVDITEGEARQLLQVASVFVYIAGTKTLLTGHNFREYFPDGGGGGMTPEEVTAIVTSMIDSQVSDSSNNAIANSAMTNYVNTSIATIQSEIEKSGATFRGIFTSQQDMDASIADKNDTAILQTTDAKGNTVYTMESYVTVEPSGELPEGYTQLLYIESNGNQAIDTGVVPGSNTGFYLKFKPKPQEIEEVFMGIDGYDNRGYHIEYQAKYYDNGYRLMYGGSTNSITLTRNEINEIEFKPLKLTVNGSTTTISDTGEWYFSGTNSFALFSYKHNTSYSTKSRMCLYEAKFYDDDKTTLIRDFVPVRNENNEVGLYDIINGQFYGNVGTGSFTAGPAADGYWVTQYSFLASV